MPRNWDADKLDALIEEMRESLWEHMQEEEGKPESEVTVYPVVGYFLHRMDECHDGPRLDLRPQGRIDGPLFNAAFRERPDSTDSPEAVVSPTNKGIG